MKIVTFVFIYMASRVANGNNKPSLRDDFNEEKREYNGEKSEHVYATVGVGFKHKLNFHRLLGSSSEPVYLELLTERGKSLFKNTWVKLAWLSNDIYGFPLEGNEGVSTYYVRATRGRLLRLQEVRLYVSANNKKFGVDYFHQIRLCTDLSKKTYLKSLDTRYALAEALSKYFLNADIRSISMSNYKYGCFYFYFPNIENNECNYDKMAEFNDKLFQDGTISENFRDALGSINIRSANLSLSYECQKPKIKQITKTMQWIKNAAPILILGGIVVIPILISCYVCRGVRKRQNERRQQQDKKFKEEAARINDQINEYKRACGLDDSLDSEPEILPSPKWKQESSIDNKKNFVSRLINQYAPRSWQGKFTTTSTNTQTNQPRRKSLNPVSRMLDIQKDSNQIIQMQESINVANLQRRNSVRKISGGQAPYTKRLVTNNTQMPFIPNQEIRRSKSVSFFDVSGGDRTAVFEDNSNTLYRRIHRDFNRMDQNSKSCTDLHTLGNTDGKTENYSESNTLDTIRKSRESSQTQNTNVLRPTPGKLIVQSSLGFPRSELEQSAQLPVTSITNNSTFTPQTGRRLSVIESVKNYAVTKKDAISNSLKEKRLLRRNLTNSSLLTKSISSRRTSEDSNFLEGRITPSAFYVDDDPRQHSELSESEINEDSRFPAKLELSYDMYTPVNDSLYYGSPRDVFQTGENTSTISTSVSEKHYNPFYTYEYLAKNKFIPPSHNDLTPYAPPRSPTVYSWSPGNDLSDYHNKVYYNPPPYDDVISTKYSPQYKHHAKKEFKKRENNFPPDFLPNVEEMNTQNIGSTDNTHSKDYPSSLTQNNSLSRKKESDFLSQHNRFAKSFEDVRDTGYRNHNYQQMLRYTKQSLQRNKSNAEEKRSLFHRQSFNYEREQKLSKEPNQYAPTPGYTRVVNQTAWNHTQPSASRYSTDSSVNTSFRNSPNLIQPNNQQRTDWKSFESERSSVVTYMDLGSEYEVSMEKETPNRRSLSNRHGQYTINDVLPYEGFFVNKPMRSISSPNILLNQTNDSVLYFDNRTKQYFSEALQNAGVKERNVFV